MTEPIDWRDIIVDKPIFDCTATGERLNDLDEPTEDE